MKLIIATDHRGVDYKKELIKLLGSEFEMVDASPENTPTDDFPDFAFKVGHMVMESNEPCYGILICGTGIGMSIAANKVKGIKCALVMNAYSAKYSRYHDDANIIALDSNMDVEFAAECVRIFASTPFCTEDEKYGRRMKKVLDYENGEYNEL